MNLIMRVICATKGLVGLLLLQVGIGKLPDIGFPDHAGRLHDRENRYCIGIPGSDS